MGSKFKKSLVSENVRESLHSWCKRVKDRNRHSQLFSLNGTITSRSVCSLDETDHETNTLCTLSRTASASSMDDQPTVATVDDEPSSMEKDV
jgi:mlo protein